MGKRKNTTERRWRVDTKHTYLVHARIPLDLMDDLRDYVDTTGSTITDTVTNGLCWILRQEHWYIPKPKAERRSTSKDEHCYGDYFLY